MGERGDDGADYLRQARFHIKAYYDANFFKKKARIIGEDVQIPGYDTQLDEDHTRIFSSEIVFAPDAGRQYKEMEDGPVVRSSLSGQLGEYANYYNGDVGNLNRIFRNTHRVFGPAYADVGRSDKVPLTSFSIQNGGTHPHYAHQRVHAGDVLAAFVPDPRNRGHWESLGGNPKDKPTIQIRPVDRLRSYWDEYVPLREKLVKMIELPKRDPNLGLDEHLGWRIYQRDLALVTSALKYFSTFQSVEQTLISVSAPDGPRFEQLPHDLVNQTDAVALILGHKLGLQVPRELEMMNFSAGMALSVEDFPRMQKGLREAMYGNHTDYFSKVVAVNEKAGIMAHSEAFARSRNDVYGTCTIPAATGGSFSAVTQV